MFSLLTFTLAAPHVHILYLTSLAIKRPYVIPDCDTLHPPKAPQTHNKHWTPHTLHPIWPGAWWGQGPECQTEVNRKWLFSLAPRSWPQQPSTFHFSLSLHTLTPRTCWSVRAPHFYSFTSQPFSFSQHVTCRVKQCGNFCVNPNYFYISMTSEG